VDQTTEIMMEQMCKESAFR